MVVFVKRKLGDDVLSVELSSKEIWACFEEATAEYSRLVHEMKIQSELVNVLGLPTSSNLTNVYPRQSLEYITRQAEAYAADAYIGGPYNAQLGYINLVSGQQDYDIYNDVIDAVSGTNLWQSIPTELRGRMRIVEVFHFEPTAAQHSLLNASNITNFLATNFNYESYVNSTVFYVLPVFEDVLRRGMLETAYKVRRSHYSYEIIGSKLRIYPAPAISAQLGRLYIKVHAQIQNPLSPNGIGGALSGSFGDSTLHGISGPSNVPLSNIPFATITQPGRQWIRQYTLALCKELLGLIRSKYSTIPIPNADIQLNGDTLRTDGREDQTRLRDQLKEWLNKLTNQSLMEQQSTMAEQLQKQLRYTPMPLGKSILIG